MLTIADFFEQYLNSDDPVPSTNDPLPNSVTYDVTYAEERKKFVPLPGNISFAISLNMDSTSCIVT